MGTEMTTARTAVGNYVAQVARSEANDLARIWKAALGAPDADVTMLVTRYLSCIEEDPALRNEQIPPAQHLRALTTCAQLGAMPATKGTPQPMREVALIPRGSEIGVMPEWRYFARRIKAHPEVADARAEIVFAGDTVELGGDFDDVVVSHRKADPFSRDVAKGLENIQGGYVQITLRDGRTRTVFCSVEHIRKARDAAKTKNVWGNWTAQMVEKTLWRHAASRDVVSMGADPLMAAAFAADDAAMGYTVTDHGPTRTLGQSTRTADVYDAIPAEAAAAVGADPQATQRPAPQSLTGDALRNAVLEAAGGDLGLIDRILEGQPLGEAGDDELTFALGELDRLNA